jgi:3',5'-cyclic AMP phosphodiesterase CpdA
MDRFAFVTDTHYWPDAPKDFGAPKMLTHGRALHDALIPAINALHPDFVLHGGDFLCGGSSFDLPTDVFQRTLREAKAYFDDVQAPLYLVPGNHDCDARTWSFDAFSRAFPSPGVLSVHHVSATLRVACANIFRGDTRTQGAGEWTDEHDALLRQANDTALSDRVPLLLCLHSWVLPDTVPDPGSDGRGCVAGAARLLSTVCGCNAVVAVFTGHRHVNRITAYRDFLIVDTACLIGYPFGFREVTVSSEGWFATRFHRLDVPNVMSAYRAREDAGDDTRWEGQPHDGDREVLIPRLANLRG